MCMCLARGGVGGVGGEWVTGLGLGFTNSVGTWEGGICVLVVVVLGVSGWAAWSRVGWCYVCVCCESVFVCDRYLKSRLACVW